MPDERNDDDRRSNEEVARLEAKRAAYAEKPWNEQDDEELRLWQSVQVWE